jgi:hypothetical protein
VESIYYIPAQHAHPRELYLMRRTAALVFANSAYPNGEDLDNPADYRR